MFSYRGSGLRIRPTHGRSSSNRRRAEPPATPSLPQNIEAEAALLGALMIDNRLVEDIQLRLKPHHFFEPLHGRIYEAILRMTDKNMVANPVTLKPISMPTRR
jgi:replicative DNA helicase